MKKICLTRGKFALVDDEDYEWLNQWKWHCSTRSYAVRRSSRKLGKQTNIYMARLIMKAPNNLYVDHIDGDFLNNQKSNLRFATNTQNQWNSKLSKHNTSGYKGVVIEKHPRFKKKYGARIRVNKKLIFLGHFLTAQEAALAYNQAAIKYHREFARLNPL